MWSRLASVPNLIPPVSLNNNRAAEPKHAQLEHADIDMIKSLVKLAQDLVVARKRCSTILRLAVRQRFEQILVQETEHTIELSRDGECAVT